MKEHVIFVCLGNICRSPLAKALFVKCVQDEGMDEFFEVDSAGTSNYEIGNQADRRTIANAKSHGLELNHMARQLERQDGELATLILVMDDANMKDTAAIIGPEQTHKIKKIRDFDPEGQGNVPDPYYGGPSDFELVYQMLSRCTRQLLIELKQKHRLA